MTLLFNRGGGCCCQQVLPSPARRIPRLIPGIILAVLLILSGIFYPIAVIPLLVVGLIIFLIWRIFF
jgi:hypothetical protein